MGMFMHGQGNMGRGLSLCALPINTGIFMYHDTPVYWMMSDKEDIHFDTFNNMFTHIV